MVWIVRKSRSAMERLRCVKPWEVRHVDACAGWRPGTGPVWRGTLAVGRGFPTSGWSACRSAAPVGPGLGSVRLAPVDLQHAVVLLHRLGKMRIAGSGHRDERCSGEVIDAQA